MTALAVHNTEDISQTETKTAGFTPDFEEKVIQAILGDKAFGEQMVEVLDSRCFDLRHTETISRLLVDYHAKYDLFPSVSLLLDICSQEISSPILKKECVGFIERIQKKPLNGDLQYVKDKSLMFFKTQAIKLALLNEVIPKIKKENLDEILPIIQAAVNKGTSRDIGYDYNKDEEARFTENEFAKIPSPWECFNKVLGGGWEGGRVVTIIGASGCGKSHNLVNIGAAALLSKNEEGKGRIVVHYTLELSEIDVARRYDACITDVEINHIPQNREKVLGTLKRKLPEGCKLIIKAYPMHTASVQTIKAHLSRLRLQGMEPDIIIIDYGDLLSSTESEERHKCNANWANMKTMAQELEVPVITATQTNRTGYASDVITVDQVAEDIRKINHSDIIITLARNPEQKAIGIGKMHFAKNRQGEDGQIFAYRIATAKSKIIAYEITDEVQEDINERSEHYSQKKKQKSADAIVNYLKNNS